MAILVRAVRRSKLVGALLRYSKRTIHITTGERQPIVVVIRARTNLRVYRMLLNHLENAGFEVYVLATANLRNLVVTQSFSWHQHIHLIWQLPRSWEQVILLTDVPDLGARKKPLKTIHWRRDFTAKLSLEPGHFVLPFPFHPQLTAQYHEHEKLHQYHKRTRTMRVLFAGNSNPAYDSVSIVQTYGKVSRWRIVEHAKQLPYACVLSNDSEIEMILSGDYLNEVVIMETSVVGVKQDKWMDLLSHADFFLSPPGIKFPLSHNVVEAMAAGAIPIINYADWFAPPLTDGKNCITFSTLDDLNIALNRALSFTPDEIARLRRGALDYYAQHLESKAFFQTALSYPDPAIYLHFRDDRPEAS